MHQNELHSQSWLTHLVSVFLLKLAWWQVGRGKRETLAKCSVLRKLLALTFAVCLSWVFHAALVALVADQNYGASVIEAFSVFV